MQGRCSNFVLHGSILHFNGYSALSSLMPCPFTGPKMFCAGPNFLSQPKNFTAFSASSKTFVPVQKPVLLHAIHLFVWHKMFVTGTKCSQIFGLAQKIRTGTKYFATCKRTRHMYLHKYIKIKS